MNRDSLPQTTAGVTSFAQAFTNELPRATPDQAAANYVGAAVTCLQQCNQLTSGPRSLIKDHCYQVCAQSFDK